MRVAIYVRTSKTEQNLGNQLLPLIQYCDRSGFGSGFGSGDGDGYGYES